ncbi:hypothetical protein Z995_18555 [Salmonella enterica subsp. arizonae serovar 18:z4,z23:- str. CVM 43480]|nr:hypothetical protein Z994_03710 [Salmonella enterica subsp. arizonae serovar 18:z4,z23:- str. CVM 43479]PNV40389.1 hypothetical protein Z995_18555 [Salmonella enterica subsp. arizonae serovar 18:z4,z23:- str. CVM 43480]PNV45882.1 hypothetical protein Z993_12805 [Salmonella enterica subsp. arizonae serovar 18:z4,z23:- str. CVM 43478]PNV51928.1 hypothetical protein Z996_07835 [Salmonella enterica subsp. arizonae serovar 18:z4,z23:- str. CVM 43481]PNV54771.1 hypothetical protein Z997_00615 [Sal
MRLFLCRNQRHRAPDCGVVCRHSYRCDSPSPVRIRTLCHHDNGSSGGAALGLAGILRGRYSYPRLGYRQSRA